MRRSDSQGNASEVRRINLMFWVTPHENELIRRRMAQAGTANLSAYLRKMAITGLIVQLDIPELKQIVSLMRRTSANINQMAKHINQGDTVAVQQVDGLHEQQEEIWAGIRGVLQQLSTLQFE